MLSIVIDDYMLLQYIHIMNETPIQIFRETRENLKKIGSKGQTYDEVIRKLLEIVQKVSFFNELDRISDQEGFIPLDQL